MVEGFLKRVSYIDDRWDTGKYISYADKRLYHDLAVGQLKTSPIKSLVKVELINKVKVKEKKREYRYDTTDSFWEYVKYYQTLDLLVINDVRIVVKGEDKWVRFCYRLIPAQTALQPLLKHWKVKWDTILADS